ncbi:MAG: hypothetical protein IJ637_08300 [Prevotella sp.]|nr:hypothetical protein [Prevotella sp.]
MKKLVAISALLAALTASCEREPLLHLFDGGDVNVELPVVELALDAYWSYELSYGITYDWRAEWYYGWDSTDLQIFGEIGYKEPKVFNLRRYYTGDEPDGEHTRVMANTIQGTSFLGQYTWGYWDILVWNDVETLDGVQSLNFDEATTLSYVTAYTNQSMVASRYSAPEFPNSFYEPEPLFSAYDRAVEISRDLEDFEYDSVKNVYVKKLDMILEPITYIYLPQIILHNNNNRIVGVDGSGKLSGMARSTVLNTGVAGQDAIAVYFNTRFKQGCDKDGETVDIVGGRLLTFGICGQNGNRIKRADEVKDTHPHYLDITMQFNNGMDSTFVFDVTQQVRERYKGGVLSIELDVDTIQLPSRKGGSAFDAVVKEFEEETHEFEM